MRDDTPVKYESIVPSLTGVREARRRGRVPAAPCPCGSVCLSDSVCSACLLKILSVWGKGARLLSTAHDRTRVRSGASSTRGSAPVKYGMATPQLTGATWALGVGGGTSGGSHRGHTAKSARFRNKRGNVDIKRGHIWRKVLAFGSKGGNQHQRRRKSKKMDENGQIWTFSTQNRR